MKKNEKKNFTCFIITCTCQNVSRFTVSIPSYIPN